MNLVNYFVRLRIDHAEMVGSDSGQPAGRTSRDEEGNDGKGTYKRECGNDDDGATPQRRRLNGHFGGLGELGRGTQRWERIGKTLSDRLVEPNRTIEVLEALLAEVAQGDVEILLLVLEQRLRRLRHEA